VPGEDPAWQALDPPQRRQRTLEALTRLCLRESRAQPLLLVFENLHWIDAETQAFLDGAISRRCVAPRRSDLPGSQNVPPRIFAR
jgi:predicted ATPase